MPLTLKEKSRVNYTTSDEKPTHDEIKTGLLQRMADSPETIAKDKTTMEGKIKRLESDLQYYMKRRDDLMEENKKLAASKSQYKSLYNREKKRVAELSHIINNTPS